MEPCATSEETESEEKQVRVQLLLHAILLSEIHIYLTDYQMIIIVSK